MAEPTELKGDDNRIYRLFKEFRDESKAVTIASISLIVAILSALLAWMATYSATEAKISVEVELRSARQEIQELREDVAVYRIRAAKLDAWLKAHGVPIEEIVE